MIILSIESSCDETAASVLEVSRGSFKFLANIVSSQIDVYKQYGGVIEVVNTKIIESGIINPRLRYIKIAHNL